MLRKIGLVIYLEIPQFNMFNRNDINVKPSEGDYCMYFQEIIFKTSDGKLMCESCFINCVHSGLNPIDCLCKKSNCRSTYHGKAEHSQPET